ncbi:hypothetical protein GBN33_13660 [Plesiomonas shigelloides]|uniref:hypothetical protein n=1 Tax=Plesiomonas shigelloides TaxID=703 RepID=UPI0012626816|nr:hypothetical protein [Plesiomonas shigelloides]KAB7696317.1 hypothetical protein GBN33_13660 [Plesiomonas shigelloides]
MKKQIIEYLHVLAVIFPLTLLLPSWITPLIVKWQLDPSAPIAILLVDSVIVACAVFIFLPTLNKLTGKLFG